MEVLRARLDLAPQDYAVDARPEGNQLGTWEGSTWARSVGVTAAAPWRGTATVWGYRPPGEHGESYAMLVERVRPAIAELQRPAVSRSWRRRPARFW